jgi:hypothetical protein
MVVAEIEWRMGRTIPSSKIALAIEKEDLKFFDEVSTIIIQLKGLSYDLIGRERYPYRKEILLSSLSSRIIPNAKNN